MEQSLYHSTIRVTFGKKLVLKLVGYICHIIYNYDLPILMVSKTFLLGKVQCPHIYNQCCRLDRQEPSESVCQGCQGCQGCRAHSLQVFYSVFIWAVRIGQLEIPGGRNEN